MCKIMMKAPTGTLRLALTDSELASESLSLTLIGRLMIRLVSENFPNVHRSWTQLSSCINF